VFLDFTVRKINLVEICSLKG